MVGVGNPNLPKLPHDLAVEYGRRGGNADNSKSKSYAKRKYCSPKCVYFEGCPGVTTSMQLPIVKTASGSFHPCFFKNAPPEVQSIFKNLFENGEEGLIKEILNVLFRLRLESLPKADGRRLSLKEMREVIEASCQVKKAIYGDKTKTEISGKIEAEIKTLNINVEIKKYIDALDQVPDIPECIEVESIQNENTNPEG